MLLMGAMCEYGSTNTNTNLPANENTDTLGKIGSINGEMVENGSAAAADAGPAEEGAEWLVYEINGYTFEYPDYYAIEITRDEVLEGLGWMKITAEIKQGDTVVAQVDCPIVETGYEVWTDWVTKERSYEKDGMAYGATLKTAQPMPDSGVQSLAQIFMHRKNFKSWADTEEDFKNSCQIMFSNYEDKIDVIEHIYNSVY